MQTLSESLEAIASAVEKNADASKVSEAVKTARDLVKNSLSEPSLKELDHELSIWQSRLSVILNELAGKKGMAKHARFWAERLRATHV